MQYVVTNSQMKSAEAICDRDSLSYIQLMENAGKACAKEIIRLVPKGSYITILCGNGNNGGDGFVISSVLAQYGISSAIILVNGMPKTECAAHEFQRLFGSKVLDYSLHREQCTEQIIRSDVVVDCIYGTGFHGTLPEQTAQAIASTESCTIRIAVDVPSGINSDTGEADEHCFKPTHTLFLAAIKKGLLSLPCNDMLGDTMLLDIGIDENAYGTDYVAKITNDEFRRPFPHHSKSAHKGTFGKLLNIAGSLNYSGAAAMSTKAALRTGVGLCTLAAPVTVVKMLAASINETTYLPLPETDAGFIGKNVTQIIGDNLAKVTAISVGCGMGNSENTRNIVEYVIRNAACPVIIDADGINSISGNIDVLKERKCDLILTPHPLEFSRISGLSSAQIAHDRISAARGFAQKYGVALVLKGANTVIASADGEVYVNINGNCGLAKGGSGDTLTGIIASMTAQGVEPFTAAVSGVYCHGLAADILAERMPRESILPSDIIGTLQEVFRSE